VEGLNQWSLVVNSSEISTLEELGYTREMQPFIRLNDPQEDFAESIAGISLYCIPARISIDLEGNLI
jgi:hypothetical protein